MVFNFTLYKPIQHPILYWLIGFLMIGTLLLLPTSAYSISANKIKKIIQSKNINFLGVGYDKNLNRYSTLSASSGIADFSINEMKLSERIPLKEYTYNQMHFTISALDESNIQIKPYLESITYFNKLPNMLDKYIRQIDIDMFELFIDYVLIKTDKSIFFESRKLPISDKIKFIFIDKINEEQLINFTEYIEKYLVATFSHEVFHFLVGYADLTRMNELREETYAHLFGKCVAYEITGETFFPLDTIELPIDFINNSNSEMKRIKKVLKKQKLIKSRIAGAIAQLYFRAIANNSANSSFHSDKIPKFCHKLFSEHNFKHPIEKKPPPWFKAFLKKNRRQ